MKYVFDSSVAFKWALREHLSDKADLFREEFQKGLHELVSPDIFPVELGHALTRAERQGRISPADGFILWADVMNDTPQLAQSLPLMPRAYALSSQARIGVYDCLYIALAEREQCPVLTADQRLVNTFPANTLPLSSL